MRQFFFLFLLIIGAFTSCKRFLWYDIRDFLPGIYVRSINHEYATGGDTLMITHLTKKTYRIVRRSGHRRIRDGNKSPYEHREEAWNADFDILKGVLYDDQKARILTPLPGEYKMLLGTIAYEKIK